MHLKNLFQIWTLWNFTNFVTNTYFYHTDLTITPNLEIIMV